MAEQLTTTSYDHVILIDSQVILESKPLDQLPWTDLFPGSILLLVVRQVQTEIDRKKGDGRLGQRARAFNRLLDGFIVSRVPAPVLVDPKVHVAAVANRAIDWNIFDDLDRDDGDDRIVAQALNAIIDDPSRIVLLSHDMRPRDAAVTNGLRAVKLPESWLREPEPSPDQKKITELEAKVKLLASDQPKLKIHTEFETSEPWKYYEVSLPTSEQFDTILRRKMAEAPLPTYPSPFAVGVDTFDYSYRERLGAWKAMVRKDISQIHQGITKLRSQHRMRVSIENIGPVSAEGLSLEIRSGNLRLHSQPYWVLLDGPPAPRPDRFGLRLPRLETSNLITPRHEPFTFYWDERGPSDQLALSCSSFRQGKQFEIEIFLELLAGTHPKAQIEVIVTASNMKGDVRSLALANVEKTAVQFADLYDVVDGKIGFYPWGEAWDDLEKYTTFRNGGALYKPD